MIMMRDFYSGFSNLAGIVYSENERLRDRYYKLYEELKSALMGANSSAKLIQEARYTILNSIDISYADRPADVYLEARERVDEQYRLLQEEVESRMSDLETAIARAYAKYKDYEALADSEF